MNENKQIEPGSEQAYKMGCVVLLVVFVLGLALGVGMFIGYLI